MGCLILVTGGARSGKSRFAQDLALQLGGDAVLFVATAQPSDDDMARRIQVHQQSRPPSWRLWERPRQLHEHLREQSRGMNAVVIDCITLLVSNALFHGYDQHSTTVAEDIATEMDDFVRACRSVDAPVIVVSNEVGLGIVPHTEIGRSYRDLLGSTNQKLAAEAEWVYFLVAGQAVELKSRATSVEAVAADIRSRSK